MQAWRQSLSNDVYSTNRYSCICQSKKTRRQAEANKLGSSSPPHIICDGSRNEVLKRRSPRHASHVVQMIMTQFVSAVTAPTTTNGKLVILRDRVCVHVLVLGQTGSSRTVQWNPTVLGMYMAKDCERNNLEMPIITCYCADTLFGNIPPPPELINMHQNRILLTSATFACHYKIPRPCDRRAPRDWSDWLNLC